LGFFTKKIEKMDFWTCPFFDFRKNFFKKPQKKQKKQKKQKTMDF